MNKYNTFLTMFIISAIAFIIFMAFYMKNIFELVIQSEKYTNENLQPNPLEILSTLFSPALIISLIIMVCSNLVCRVIGIVSVAKSKTVADGEKALWILGFVLMSFITSIVFLVMAKGRKFAE